ncbi:MAG: DNA polymerase III subunit alpha [Lachnospiraceae bacterium]|nr:DNA polymerase III subunit alpha [Lachnospiraceae bacterium]
MAFTHLHVHTEYSLLDGSNKIKEYIKRVKELGMTHAAITDHGTMYGCVAFYEEAKKQGITPIIGCEVYVAPGSRFNKEATDNKYYHLLLLAENDLGYHNLMRLVSIGFKDGYYYKPRVDKEVLREYHEGLICLSACLQGEVAVNLTLGLYDEAKKVAKEYEDIFGKGNYFLEIQDHGIEEQRIINPEIYRLSKELDIPLVATNDVHYTYAEDADAHDLLLCLQTGKIVTDTDRMKYAYGQFYVRSEEEMRELFPYAEEAIDNTQLVAERCHVNLEDKTPKLPHFEVPEGFTSESYLRHICEEGLKKRYPNDDGTAKARLDYELSVIENMGFVDYFLIVMDFIAYAKEHKIMVGPGRGSGAGSIVAYCLKITNIDPIKFGLIFERFLNPGRVTMPDIDIDFGDERRDEVIDYVINKYGAEKVSRIITFGTLKAKGVVRDVARVLGLPYEIGDRISKSIPARINDGNTKEVTLSVALEVSQDLKKMYEADENVKKVIDMSFKLEHLPRHSSVHPAGVLIAPKEVEAFVPLAKGTDDILVTQYDAPTLEAHGLLKMDFLSLRTLTVLEKACANVKKTRGIDINLEEINMEDEKVYEYIGTGDTDGIFQLESGGMRAFMKKLKPKNLENVMAGIALYRPGPMQYIDNYIKCKENPEDVSFLCDELKPILEPTYGCMIYQEQVMQIVRDLAGFSMTDSDNVRKAMSKKKAADMEKYGKIFIYGDEEHGIDGCIKRQISESVAVQIYKEMQKFAEYAFNKSHSAVYAVVSYQTAYMKYYYPVEYMAALITCSLDNPVKTAYYINSAREMGIEVLPPDINEGFRDFTAKDGKLIYSLKAIKNVGGPVIDRIVAERNENGRFESISDFIRRMGSKDVNKRAVENFIKAGAFDSLGGNRKQYIQVYEMLIDDVIAERKKLDSNQMTIFDMLPTEEKKAMEIKLPNVEEFPKDMILQMEREVLGVYISGHPLDDVKDIWKKNINAVSSDFIYQPELEGSRLSDKKQVKLGGIVTNLNVRLTKKKETMAIFELEDLYGRVEAMVFPKAYERVRDMLIEDNLVFVSGRVSTEDEENSKIIVEEITSFEDVPKTLWLKFDDMEKYNELWDKVYEVLWDHRGVDSVNIRVIKENKLKTLTKKELGVKADENIIPELEAILGEKSVVIR